MRLQYYDLTRQDRDRDKQRGCEPMIESFIFSLRAAGRSSNTIRFYREKLKHLIDYSKSLDKEFQAINKNEIQHYIVNLLDRNLSPVTINGTIKAWRKFYEFGQRELLINHNPIGQIQLLREYKTVKSIVSPGDFLKMVAKCDAKSFHGARTIAMLLLTFETMIRLSELTGLCIEDVKLDTNPTILVRAATSKSRRDRILSFSATTAQKLINYINIHRRHLPGSYVFCTKRGKRIQRRNLERIFERAGKEVDIKVCPQAIRRSGATAFIRGYPNLKLLQYILGHKSVKTTENFYLSSEGASDDVIKAYQSFSPLFGQHR